MEIETENGEGPASEDQTMFGVLEDGNKKGQTAPVAAGTHAADTVVVFKGLRGGRPRKDGLVPGSIEAAEADLARDRERKRRKRERDAATIRRIPINDGPHEMAEELVAPLPPAIPGLAGAPQTPDDNARPGVGPEIVAMVEWLAEDAAPLFDEAIPLLEEWREGSRERKLTRAGIDEGTIAEILADSKWNPRLTKILQERGSRLAAKYLNMMRVSAAYKDEIVFGCALLAIAAGEIRTNRRLDKLIVLARKS